MATWRHLGHNKNNILNEQFLFWLLSFSLSVFVSPHPPLYFEPNQSSQMAARLQLGSAQCSIVSRDNLWLGAMHFAQNLPKQWRRRYFEKKNVQQDTWKNCTDLSHYAKVNWIMHRKRSLNCKLRKHVSRQNVRQHSLHCAHWSMFWGESKIEVNIVMSLVNWYQAVINICC